MARRMKVDDFRVHGREAYWRCRNRIGDTSFSDTPREDAKNAGDGEECATTAN